MKIVRTNKSLIQTDQSFFEEVWKLAGIPFHGIDVKHDIHFTRLYDKRSKKKVTFIDITNDLNVYEPTHDGPISVMTKLDDYVSLCIKHGLLKEDKHPLISTQKYIKDKDWDQLVFETYGKPYAFQQQDGCKSRGDYHIDVPDPHAEDFEHTEIEEKVNGPIMGVSFDAWKARDPKQKGGELKTDFDLSLFWSRNFYPDINVLAKDLYEKGLIPKGRLIIKVDW